MLTLQNVMLLRHGRVGLLNLFRSAWGSEYHHPKLQSRLIASVSTTDAWKHDSIELPIGVSGRIKLE